MRHRVLHVLVGLSVVVTASVALAHPDDPKTRDRIPPYRGPGYRGGSMAGGPPVNFPFDGVMLRSWLPLGDFGPQISNGNDCWGYVPASGREYALMGLSHGTAFVEITDPDNPVIVAMITGPTSLWRDIKVYQHYAYAVSEGGGGIQVIDMADIDNGVVTLVGSVTDGGTVKSHNVAIDEASGFLYRCGGNNNGLRIYSLADPANPVFVGQWLDRYVHDAEIVTFTDGPNAGKQIAYCSSGFNGGWVETGLDILDVTDKSNIINIKRVFWGNAAYSHQVWLSADAQLAYVNDELDESDFGLPTTTIVVDVSDLANAFVASTFTNGVTSIGHNIYTVGDLLFEANYRSGVRIFDMSADPLNGVEIAYFDTWPEDDNPNFNGLWNVYPFFPSGVFIGSDLEKGLFVWTMGVESVSFSYPDGLPDVIDPDGDTILVALTPGGGGVIAPGSAKLIYDAGAGFVEQPLTELGGGLYEAVFPPIDCGTRVSFYFEVVTTSGVTFRDPGTAPATTYSAVAALAELTELEDTLEVPSGWTVGAADDTATTGVWERVDPVGTSAQPEDDHTPDPGTMCFVTGQQVPGDGAGANDVDDGKTTLFSPVMDLSGTPDAVLSYWRWYSNSAGGSPGADVFLVNVSNDGGATWTNVETIGPTGDGTSGGWMFHEFTVADFVAPTSQVQLQFVASDAGQPSLIEAAVDDVRVSVFPCTQLFGDFDLDFMITLADHAAFADCIGGPDVPPTPADPANVAACLAAFDAASDGDVDMEDFELFQLGFTGP